MSNYDMIPAVRRSDLWELRKSPAHYLYRVMNPTEPTAAMLFGTAAHKFILEGDDFWNEYAMAPDVDRRTKAGKEQWQQFIDELGDKQPIKFDDMAVIQKMDDAIRANATAAALLKTGRHEVPIEWRDEGTGEYCKCRPDVLTEYNGKKYIVDYKTTTSCADGHFERECRTYGYKLQAGMYTDGVFNATFEDYEFAFVAQEKTAPYAVRVYFCDPDFVLEGMDLFKELITIYSKCKQAGEWPGYENEVLYGE